MNQLDNVQLCGPALDQAYDDNVPMRLPGNLNVSFGNVDGEALLLAMGKLAVSSGAACTSTDPEPSHVLRAIGLGDDKARSSLRFGLGRFNNAADVDFAVERVVDAVRRLRKLTSPRGTKPHGSKPAAQQEKTEFISLSAGRNLYPPAKNIAYLPMHSR
jgi:cysteine sulfinate desulfinase/cysteine desulfurase-like protein